MKCIICFTMFGGYILQHKCLIGRCRVIVNITRKFVPHRYSVVDYSALDVTGLELLKC